MCRQWLQDRLLAKGCPGSTPANSTSIVGQILNAGGGQAGGPVQEEKARPGGPVQNISDVGGGEGQPSSLSAQELTHSSLYNIITHKRLSPCQQFSASQDAHSISLALNDSCPRAHFHTGNNESRITFNGITVQPPNSLLLQNRQTQVYKFSIELNVFNSLKKYKKSNVHSQSTEINVKFITECISVHRVNWRPLSQYTSTRQACYTSLPPDSIS